MKYFYLVYSIILLVVACITGCKPDVDVDSPSLGKLSFTQYIAIGDRYTAGYSNGGLYETAQKGSFPVLISAQFQQVNNFPFRVPLLRGNGSGFWYLEKVKESTCEKDKLSVLIKKNPEESGWKSNISVESPFHNLGIPYIHTEDLDSTKSNPFFERMLQNGENKNLKALIKNTPADLYTIWMGLEDFLTYATNGISENTYWDPVEYSTQMRELLTSLPVAKKGGSVLIANLPDPTDFPYFRYIASEISIPGQSCQKRKLYISTMSAGIPVVRESSPEDLILFPALDSLKAMQYNSLKYNFGISPSNPIPDNWVLDAKEAAGLRSQIQAYNKALKELVAEVNTSHAPTRFILVDLHERFKSMASGKLVLDGVKASNAYVIGGLFSLDGLTLTQRGNAWLGNIFLESINKNFAATIPLMVVSDHQGVIFP